MEGVDPSLVITRDPEKYFRVGGIEQTNMIDHNMCSILLYTLEKLYFFHLI